MNLLHYDDISCHGHLAMTNVLKRSGKLGMLLRDEFLTPLRYYKLKIEADPSASLERRYTVNELGSNIERHRRELLPATACSAPSGNPEVIKPSNQ